MHPETMVRWCLEHGIGVLAVTDHNEFGGYEELQEAAHGRIVVIPGEEIKTAEGELIGLFLSAHIPRGLGAEETARAIRAQGGVVNVPHPFDGLRGGRLTHDALDRLVSLGLVDMLEAFNARITHPANNDAAYEYARAHDLPVTAGSDAHTYAEIGAAYIEIRPFDGPQDFIAAVREGALRGGLSPWPVHLASTWAKIAKKASTTVGAGLRALPSPITRPGSSRSVPSTTRPNRKEPAGVA